MLLCEMSIKYVYITIIRNKHFGKIEKKTLHANVAVNGLYDTKLSRVIQIIHRNVGLKVIIVSICLHLCFTR